MASRHCCEAGQSASPPQSAQSPRVGWQTWPGHWREEVQAVAATQRWPMQIRSVPAQSARVRQPTQTPRSRSQTWPLGAHAGSDWQASAAASGGGVAPSLGAPPSEAASKGASRAASAGGVIGPGARDGLHPANANTTHADSAPRLIIATNLHPLRRAGEASARPLSGLDGSPEIPLYDARGALDHHFSGAVETPPGRGSRAAATPYGFGEVRTRPARRRRRETRPRGGRSRGDRA